MFKTYYLLTKPGIIRGNALTALAGFFLAAKTDIELGVLAAMLAGISLVIASACVFNNYIDRGIDKKMLRTRKRALVSGAISSKQALQFGVLLGLAGACLLGIFTNLLTLFTALTGFIFYVVIYGIYKRRSVHGTLIGSIAGAIPPVAGYTAASNRLDVAAFILFLILVFWQMPHFYAIALYRSKDYAAAKIPVLPVVNGLRQTRLQILCYITAFTLVAVSLNIFGYLSPIYGLVALSLGISWFIMAILGFEVHHASRWARRMFRYSLVVITVLSLTIVADAALL